MLIFLYSPDWGYSSSSLYILIFQACITDTLTINWPALKYPDFSIDSNIQFHWLSNFVFQLFIFKAWNILNHSFEFLRIPVLGTNVILMYLPFSVFLLAPYIFKYCFFDIYFKSELSGYHHFSMDGSTQREAHLHNMNL